MSFLDIFPGFPQLNRPTIDSGITAGDVLGRFSSDFLGKNDLIKLTNNFTDSMTPVISENPVSFFNTSNLIGNNPNSLQILKSVNGLTNQITSGSFLNELPFNATFTLDNANTPAISNPATGQSAPLFKPDLNAPQSDIRLPFQGPLTPFQQNPTALDALLGTFSFSTSLFQDPLFLNKLFNNTLTA